MAPPVLTLDQIKMQLQTQWGGAEEGSRYDWYDGTGQVDGSIYYALPDIAFVRDQQSEEAGFVAMTAIQKAFAREAFELWDDLIASSLIENTDIDGRVPFGFDEQISFGYSSTTERGGSYTAQWAVPEPDGSSTFFHAYDHAKIWMSSSWSTLMSSNMAYGGYGMTTYVHEIGHALGLSHPGTYDASDEESPIYADDAEYTQDTRQWTVMSYFDAGDDGTAVDRQGLDLNGDGAPDYAYAATPLLHDIAAIQAKYGADMTTRTGDTVYGFNSNAGRGAFDFTLNQNPVIAIWDAGGTDRLDASGYSQDQRIDLDAGSLSDIGALTLNVGIAYGATIENATGGTGNDSITGNGASNILDGNSGNDRLHGMDDLDTLYGGAGNDELTGGIGFVDQLYGGSGDDTYFISDLDEIHEAANGGRDTVLSSIRWVLAAEIENLTLTGTTSVNGFGNNLDNLLQGNSGNNYLQGFVGNDLLMGGGGNDYYELSDRSFIDPETGYAWDTVLESADEGIDTVSLTNIDGSNYFMTANVENAVVIGAGGLSVIGNELANVLTGNNAYNLFFGQEGNDTLNGGGAMDDLVGEGGDDTYVLDDQNRAGQFAVLAFDNVIEAANGGIDTVLVRSLDNPDTFATDGYVLGANVENGTITSVDAFNLTGNGLSNQLEGNRASNVLTGGDGDDILNGVEGVDTLVGGEGGDTYVLADIASAGQFAELKYDAVVDTGISGTDFVMVTAIDNPDTVATDGYVLEANIEYGAIRGTGAFNLTGNGLSNVLTGNNSDNKLSGGAAADSLDGRLGMDTLTGGEGDDTYVLSDMNAAGKFAILRFDAVVESDGQGIDLVLVTALDNPDTVRTDGYILGDNIENASLSGAIDYNLGGNQLANSLTGNSFANTISGFDGSDKLRGMRGRDLLDGGAGADWLWGGTGQDRLVGGKGIDRFVFATDDGQDVVSDFHARGGNHDVVNLAGLNGVDDFADLIANHIDQKHGDIIIRGSGNDTLKLTDVKFDHLDAGDFLF